MATVKEIVAERFIAQIEAGVPPWKRPWQEVLGAARNYVSQHRYRGINTFLVPRGEYVTFNQCKKCGGEWPTASERFIVVFYKPMDAPKKDVDAEDDEHDRRFMLRYYSVSNVLSCGIEPHVLDAVTFQPHERIERAEAVIDGYRTIGMPSVKFGLDQASYSPLLDRINMPDIKQFVSPEEYYSTFFHELTHSTGHKSRLERNFGKYPPSERYGREELVAEMGSAILAWDCQIATGKMQDNQASYLSNWINAIKGEPNMVVWAGGKAQKAVDYMTNGKTVKKEEVA